ncbi:amino acid permease [Acidobacteriota bacterium]
MPESGRGDQLGTDQPVQKFGTFLGVYTPSVLTILGLIMYLRFGWVVGNLGLPLTLVIVIISSSITFITGLSASAVATNMRVGVGGEYFLISRSLGLELGGAIGIPLFMCRTLSITFYSFGLAESMAPFFRSSNGQISPLKIQILAAVIILFITAVSGKSAGLALKMQIPIMIAVGISILALIAGVIGGGVRGPELTATYRTAPAGFWYVFAIFFPAVTGFTAGIGMSGDLKDPQKSIPKGTILAIVTGAFTYMFILVLLGITAKVSHLDLAEPGVIWIKVAVLGAWLVYPGIWGAILSSAFGSVLGGPRVLQALASDGLAPRFLSRLSKTGQPTIATWVSGIIALAAVALGGLNAVAELVSILFLTLYIMINLSAGLEKLVGDPSYRPKINVPWYVSLAGSIGAIIVMALINPAACLIAIILESALYTFLRRRATKKRWGDVRAGLWVSLARFALLKLRNHKIDPRNWRPQILLFTGNPAKRKGLVRMANWFSQNRGLVTAVQLVVGDIEQEFTGIEEKRLEMENALEKRGLVAFSEVDIVSDYENGAVDIVQANGIAGLQSNTVMFGWPKKPDRMECILRIMRSVSRTGKSTIITRLNWAHEPGQDMRIDIWWRGLYQNGDLMLLLAHLLKLNPEWSNARIRICSIVESDEEKKKMEVSLKKLVPETRIYAETEVIVKPENKTSTQVMHSYSQGSAIVFLGMMDPEHGAEAQYAQRLNDLASGFNTVIFVRNAGEFSGHLVHSDI